MNHELSLGRIRQYFRSRCLSLRQMAFVFVSAFQLSSIVAADVSKPTSTSTKPSRFALLVGVSEYSNLPKSSQLNGTGNDVRLMRELLQSRFGFDAGSIKTLQGPHATGDAIRAGLLEIADAVGKLPEDGEPAQVVFHFSGHGGQLPDQESDGRDETDGLDETLVPADATIIGGEEDIRDDELNQLAHQICKGGKANLWIILDCCHSGTGTRSIGMPGLVGYRAFRRDVQPTKTPVPPVVNKLPDTAVALYACRDLELEPEYFDGQERYGLLTRFMTRVLMDSEGESRLSYASLRDAVASRYRQDRQIGVSAPVPQIEGSAELLDRGVLGDGPMPPLRYWMVDGSLRKPMLMAGSFHGVSLDSIYRLHNSTESIPDATDEHQLEEDAGLGFARVAKVEAAVSVLEFVRWDGKEWISSRWPRSTKRACATIHTRGDQGFGLRVLVQDLDNSKTKSIAQSTKLHRTLQDIFKKSGVRGDWLSLAKTQAGADIVLKLSGDSMAAFPAACHTILPSDNAKENANPLAGGWGPIDLLHPNAPEETRRLLRQIAKARNLLRIAAHGKAGGKRPIQIKIELLTHDQDSPNAEPIPWTNATPGKSPASFQMRSGDCYKYKITNCGNQPAYISVLHINSDMAIEQVFPYQAGNQVEGSDDTLLRPHESRVEGPFQCNGIGSPSFGNRNTIVLATAQPNSFYMLTEPSLPTVRSLDRDSDLTELLMSGTYFKTRSRKRPAKLYDDSWGSAIVQWVVRQ